jgi:hypothetical protein
VGGSEAEAREWFEGGGSAEPSSPSFEGVTAERDGGSAVV